MSIKTVLELTPENLRPFGTVLSCSEKEATCDDANIRYVKQIFTCDLGEISTGLMTCKKREMVLTQLEKHSNTPEIMVNLSGDAILVLAEPDYDFKGENDKLKAFLIRQGDAYSINPGVWHWASYPVEKETVDFLIVFARGTEDRDITTQSLQTKLEVNV